MATLDFGATHTKNGSNKFPVVSGRVTHTSEIKFCRHFISLINCRLLEPFVKRIKFNPSLKYDALFPLSFSGFRIRSQKSK